MKKHHFLQVDVLSTVKLSQAEKRKLSQWLGYASEVLAKLNDEGMFVRVSANEIKNLKISLLICGESRIKALNFEHRRKNKVTDVLSFPAGEVDFRGELFLGDLAICFPQAKRQARQFEIGLWDEFIHLFFHGTLHLIGYDHEVSAKEERTMQKWEDLALNQFSKIKSK